MSQERRYNVYKNIFVESKLPMGLYLKDIILPPIIFLACYLLFQQLGYFIIVSLLFATTNGFFTLFLVLKSPTNPQKRNIQVMKQLWKTRKKKLYIWKG